MAGGKQLSADLHRRRMAPGADAVPETDAVSHIALRHAQFPLEVTDTVIVFYFPSFLNTFHAGKYSGLGLS